MNTPTNTLMDGEPVALPECKAVGPEHASALAAFFERMRAQEIGKFFHPHPLTADEAQKLAAYRGLDFYGVLVQDNVIVGYGMLRGWDEGYEVPSIGVVIDPAVQRRGYARLLLDFLHATARQRGANRIRATVNPDNTKTVALSRSLGYVFQGPENGRLVGILQLNPPVDPSPGEIAR